jgi:hypothetical protein
MSVEEAIERSRKRWPGRAMSPGWAAFLRRLSTALQFHRNCPRRACRRAGACAAADVLCYRETEADMQPIAASLFARRWELLVAEGRDPGLGPTWSDDQRRRIAYEAAEIPRILAGEYGGDDDLTPYQLWMKKWIVPMSREIAAVAAATAARQKRTLRPASGPCRVRSSARASAPEPSS